MLCGGGITGAVYELGALAALDDWFSAGFTVSQFDIYVGTSAGAFMSTLMAAGITPTRLARAVMDDEDQVMPVAQSDLYKVDVRELAGIARDAARILATSLRRALRRRTLTFSELAKDLEDALPSGLFSLSHYEAWVARSLAAHGVPLRFDAIPRELFITATELDSGERAVFGKHALDATLRDVPISTAICASSAIPGFYEPMTILGRDYIDGAVTEAAHLDVALDRGADLVVIVNPMVPIRAHADTELPSAILGTHRLRDKGLLTVTDQARRLSTRTKLHLSIRRSALEHPEATILIIEPQRDDADMLLSNPMNFAVRRRLLRYGYDSAARLLCESHAEFAPAFLRHRIHTDAGKLRQRPWETHG